MKNLNIKSTIGFNDDGEKVRIHVEFKNANLSITGTITDHGLEVGSGQINPIDPTGFQFTNGWNAEKLTTLNEIWDLYHLNDMNAGTPAQTALVRQYTQTHRFDYDEVCIFLAENDMFNDNGYKYGNGWLRIEVPADVIEWLGQL